LQAETGGKPVYRYLYARVRPAYMGMPGEPPPTPRAGATGPRGASHSSEIQYAMGNLDLDTRYKWDAVDHEISRVMQAYFANFVKTFNPNGAGLPEWPAYNAATKYERMRIDEKSQAAPETDRDRYLALDAALHVSLVP
jgi:para-nitrobenzyl esterase